MYVYLGADTYILKPLFIFEFTLVNALPKENTQQILAEF